MPPFKKCFREKQQKYVSSSKTGVKYYRQIIKYCLPLAARSPSINDDMRCDGNTTLAFLCYLAD